MNRILHGLLPLSVFLLLCHPSSAQDVAPSESEMLRKEMQQLREDYEQRLRHLEQRLQELEQREIQSVQAAVTNGLPTDAPAEPAALDRAARAQEFARQQFIDPTESYERALNLQQPGPLRERVDSILENYIDFGGYFRAGYGRDDQGGPQVGFIAPGADAKYRLGNEAENYGELILGKSWYVPGMFSMDPTERADGTPTGPIARAQFRISFYNPYTDLGSGSGTDVALPEAWAAIGNVLPSQPDMKIWAGNRFYRRQDIHVNDFFFYNMSGGGGGMEDLDLGFGKLALAWIGTGSQSSISSVPQPDPVNEAGFSKSSVDLRLYDVELPLGVGELGLAWAVADAGLDVNTNSVPRSDGLAFNFIHTVTGLFTPEDMNRISLQIGTGPAKTFNNSFETFSTTNGFFIRPEDRDSWRLRVTENLVVQPWDCFAISPVAIYQYTDYRDAGGAEHWASLGARPIFFFNRYLSLAFEGGVDWTRETGTDISGQLYKLTLAPQVQLQNTFFSRPSIRAFLTYATWSDSFQGSVGGTDYADATEAWTYGIQMEVWW